MQSTDRGWAWMVVFGVMLQNFLVHGFLKSFGLFFVEFTETFNSSASMTSAVLGAQAASFCLMAPVCLHYFCTKFSYKWLMFTGAIISSTGIALSFFASNMIYLLFTCGLMIGIGNAFMHGPSLVMIGHYFKKRLSIANGLAMAGGSAGQFAFPPLVLFLFNEYSLRGSLLVIGGLMFNCCVSAALMRQFQAKAKVVQTHKELQFDNGQQEREDDLSDSSSPRSISIQPTKRPNESCKMKLIDLSLCKRPIFPFLLVSSALGHAGSTLHTIYLVPYARDVGIDEKMTSLLVIIVGVADLCGKLVCGCIADTGWVKRYKLLAVSMFVSGVFAQFLIFFSSLESIIGYGVVVGMIGGFYSALSSPVLVDFLGVENLAKSLGITLFCEGAVSTVTPIMLGYLRDTTQTYFASFHMLGLFLILSALSLFFTRIVKLCCHK